MGSGAEVEYLLRAYGKLVSFLFTWTNALVLRPSSLAIMVLVSGEHLEKLAQHFHLEQMTSYTLSLSTLLVVCIINSMPNKYLNRLLNLLTSFKVVSLLFVIGLGVIVFQDNHDKLNKNELDNAYSHSFRDYAPAFLAALWAFDGWSDLAYATEEMVNVNQFTRVLNVALPLTTFLYVLVNVAYFLALNPEKMATSTTIGVDLAELALGKKKE